MSKFRYRIFCYNNSWKERGIFWFRIFGIGLLIKDYEHPKRGEPMFSERYGKFYGLILNGKQVKVLK